jgi:hypothetical protein
MIVSHGLGCDGAGLGTRVGFGSAGIEYAAKPRLEARKELLLEGYRRRRRELLGHLDTISMIAGSWSELPAGERDRQWQRLAVMTETMFDSAWLYATSYRRVFRLFGRPSAFDLIGSYLYTARGVFLADRPRAEVVGALGELTGPLSALLSAGWRVRARLRTLSRMSALLAKYTGPGPESAAA